MRISRHQRKTRVSTPVCDSAYAAGVINESLCLNLAHEKLLMFEKRVI